MKSSKKTKEGGNIVKISCIGTVLLLVLLLFASCNQGGTLAEQRAERARKSSGDIIIGAAAPWSDLQNGLWQGITFAVEEINAKGGILGRKLQVIKKDDKGSVAKGQIVAQQFAENIDVIAVLGHYNSYVSVPTSIIYEYYGVLMMSPASTSPRLTQRGFDLVFRNLPSDLDFGEKLSDFCVQRGLEEIMIYHSNNEYGQGLANAFETQAESNGIVIPDRRNYDSLSGARTFRNDLAFWKANFDFDAIFLAGVTPQVAMFVKEARNLGINVPVIGGNGLDSHDFLEIAGQSADNTYVGSVFTPDAAHPKVKHFVSQYLQKYEAEPDVSAAQGYDAVHLLSYAIDKAKSTVPEKIADELHALKGWEGVTGAHTFTQSGDVVDMDIFIKFVRNGRFEYVGSY